MCLSGRLSSDIQSSPLSEHQHYKKYFAFKLMNEKTDVKIYSITIYQENILLKLHINVFINRQLCTNTNLDFFVLIEKDLILFSSYSQKLIPQSIYLNLIRFIFLLLKNQYKLFIFISFTHYVIHIKIIKLFGEAGMQKQKLTFSVALKQNKKYNRMH